MVDPWQGHANIGEVHADAPLIFETSGGWIFDNESRSTKTCEFADITLIELSDFRNARVTHIQGKTMNKHLDKIWPQLTSKQGKLDGFAAKLLFRFLPCMWGLGFQNDSPF